MGTGDRPKIKIKRLLWRSFLALILGVFAGAQGALIQYLVRLGIHWLSDQFAFYDSSAQTAFISGMSSGLALFMLLAVLVITPWSWRRINEPDNLRLLAYIVMQTVGISFGLMGEQSWFSVATTFIIIAIGTIVWWQWQRRWRGVGIAPSVLSGILRPPIHSGQIWFAYVPGEKETKNRPVVVLGAAGSGRWNIAYYTTRGPKSSSLEKYYLKVDVGQVRGMVKDNWINISAVRVLKRNQFRTYIGLVPKELYVQVCVALNLELDDQAWVIEEESAGSEPGPMDIEIKNTLGMGSRETPASPVDSLWTVARELLRWILNQMER
jgi:mRNA-degrading endonuclease toxin of MazEF toxin-antitoxin module